MSLKLSAPWYPFYFPLIRPQKINIFLVLSFRLLSTVRRDPVFLIVLRDLKWSVWEDSCHHLFLHVTNFSSFHFMSCERFPVLKVVSWWTRFLHILWDIVGTCKINPTLNFCRIRCVFWFERAGRFLVSHLFVLPEGKELLLLSPW